MGSRRVRRFRPEGAAGLEARVCKGDGGGLEPAGLTGRGEGGSEGMAIEGGGRGLNEGVKREGGARMGTGVAGLWI